MRAKLGLKINKSEKIKGSEKKKWGIGKLSKKKVKEEFISDVIANTISKILRRGGRYCMGQN
jgi:1,2-phenylacetyl-CoA epoxidase catalytic subunit